MKMDFQVKEIVFPILAGFSAIMWWAISTAITGFISYLRETLKDTVGRFESNLDRLANSVQELNVNVARVVEQVEAHDKRLSNLERQER